MGRDVGRDEGREQAEWRDLVARLELPASINPSDAPWPDRENLRSVSQPGTVNSAEGSALSGEAGPGAPAPDSATSSDTEPAAPATTTGAQASQAEGSDTGEAAAKPTAAAGTGAPALGGPRDYELDEPRDADLDEGTGDRYIPPPVPPQPSLDPVAKGAWLALFGGPAYLLVATLLSWEIPGWAALTAVIAFVTGFLVLVVRLGDGPSKRDGPDQGAVV